jgi:hypothetical protein
VCGTEMRARYKNISPPPSSVCNLLLHNHIPVVFFKLDKHADIECSPPALLKTKLEKMDVFAVFEVGHKAVTEEVRQRYARKQRMFPTKTDQERANGCGTETRTV